ncbi:MAG: SDR family NAD(P)-dependent oxidoreductase [Myxococcota bacterium]
MATIKTVLITGANAGLGKEAARQLALDPSITKIYLGARNEQRAREAKRSLEDATGRSIFELLIFDLNDLESARAAAEVLPEPVDAVLLNAGGAGGPNAMSTTADGVLELFAFNVLGHVALTEALLHKGKVSSTVLFAGTEATRGVPYMRIPAPDLRSSSEQEFASIVNGSWFDGLDAMAAYGVVKYVGTMWMSAMARRHPQLRFVTVSPGATRGTNGPDQLPAALRFLYKYVAFPMLTAFGRAHGIDVGARRYLEVLADPSTYKSGGFYASAGNTTSGPLVEQTPLFEDLGNEAFQDNAYAAVQRFVGTTPVRDGAREAARRG